MTEILKEIEGRNDCEDLCNWVTFTVGVILSAITGDFCIAVPMCGSWKGFKNIKLKNDRFTVVGSACLSLRKSELESHWDGFHNILLRDL